MQARINGAEEFVALARKLHQLGRTDLRRELDAAINKSVKSSTADVSKSLNTYLPNQYAAVLKPELKIRPRRRSTGRNVGVRLVASAVRPDGKQRALASLNQGKLFHPLWGSWRPPRQVQKVKPGFFDEPLLADAPKVRKQLLLVFDRIARKLAG
jgi:hypothetical protein